MSDLDLDRVETELDSTRQELIKVEAQLKALNAEEKQLAGFKGPDYERRLRQADSMRQEKDQLENIKTELTAKVARFTSEAKRHRDALASGKP